MKLSSVIDKVNQTLQNVNGGDKRCILLYLLDDIYYKKSKQSLAGRIQ